MLNLNTIIMLNTNKTANLLKQSSNVMSVFQATIKKLTAINGKMEAERKAQTKIANIALEKSGQLIEAIDGNTKTIGKINEFLN